MIEVYLNLNGNAKEAADYYARVFEAGVPDIMYYSDMPKEENIDIPEGSRDLVMHGAVNTFAGLIMLADNEPGVVITPNQGVWLTLSHKDLDRLRRVFDALAGDGEALMPLEPSFFSPLYGQVKDKFGFYWHIMSWEEPKKG